MEDRPELDAGAIRSALERERVELLELSAAHDAEGRPVALDQQSVGRLSRMDAMQVQAMAKVVSARRHGRLQRIEAALGRLDEDDFGYCLGCGDDIPAQRLKVDLTVTRCISCAGGTP